MAKIQLLELKLKTVTSELFYAIVEWSLKQPRRNFKLMHKIISLGNTEILLILGSY